MISRREMETTPPAGAKPKLPNRRVVVKELGYGEGYGRPLSERAYVTPRFPEGIKLSELPEMGDAIQRETMLVWFIANFDQAKGTFFGFAEAQGKGGVQYAALPGPLTFNGTASLDGSRTFGTDENPGMAVGGFGEAPWFDGGTAHTFLMAEFGSLPRADLIAEVAAALPGQWVLKPDDTLPAAPMTDAERRAALAQLLDGLARDLQQLPASHGNRGHNQSPEGLVDASGPLDRFAVLTTEERDTALRATADMRMSVLSADHSRLDATWELIAPVLAKLRDAVLAQIGTFFTKFTGTLAVGAGVAALGWIAVGLGIIDKAEVIKAFLNMLGRGHP